MGSEFLHAERRADGQTGITKLIVAFSNANAPKNLWPPGKGRRFTLRAGRWCKDSLLSVCDGCSDITPRILTLYEFTRFTVESRKTQL